MSSPNVSIIILNWNGWRDTIECLESLEKINYQNYEIVVVDNSSKDDSVPQIKKYLSESKFQNLKFKVQNSNLGFAGGSNKGIEYAVKNGADYILLLNNDTLVEPDFLNEMVKIGEGDKKIGLIGPKIYFYPPENPPRAWFCGGKINWLKTRGSHIKHGLSEKPEIPKTSDYLTGCCLLIKRKVIEKIGGLSEEYFLYYEDTDYCLRAQKFGWQCVYAPSAVIWHKISRSAKEFSPSYIYYHTRNGLMLARKNNPFWKTPLVYLFSFYLAAKQAIKCVFLPQKRGWAKMVLLGIYDFWKNKTGKLEL